VTSSASTVLSSLAQTVTDHPGRPLVTFYDGSTGERIELSAVSFDNWVSKIANLFSDQLMLDPGEVVALSLPPHWLSGVTLLGAWTAGLQVTFEAPSSIAPAASVVGPGALDAASAVAGQPIACSLAPLAAPFTSPLPPGWLDFAREVPGQPDVVLAPAAVEPSTVAVLEAARPVTHGDLVEQGWAVAERRGLTAGSRLLTDANSGSTAGLVPALVAPLVSGASVVLAVRCDASQRAAIGTQERVTVSAWAGEEVDPQLPTTAASKVAP
jgi:uncharacterized protein (TIGR03089 family)